MKMKLLFALFLTLQLNLFLVTGTSYAEDQTIQQRAAHEDLLSSVSCRYLKENGYCKNLIKKKLCKNTCHCTNKLSPKSCETVKKVNCKTPWSIRFCRYTCDQCSRISCRSIFPLGMKSGAIPDSKITASTMFNSNHSPTRARLDMKKAGLKPGCWAARHNDVNQWLQVDLGQPTRVTHIATQGRQDLSQWVTSYTLQYSLNGRTFASYGGGKVFKGNSNRNTVVKHALNPIIARFIRLRPKTWYAHISMRMELYGCV